LAFSSFLQLLVSAERMLQNKMQSEFDSKTSSLETGPVSQIGLVTLQLLG
jgi:hypothetical protein